LLSIVGELPGRPEVRCQIRRGGHDGAPRPEVLRAPKRPVAVDAPRVRFADELERRRLVEQAAFQHEPRPIVARPLDADAHRLRSRIAEVSEREADLLERGMLRIADLARDALLEELHRPGWKHTLEPGTLPAAHGGDGFADDGVAVGRRGHARRERGAIGAGRERPRALAIETARLRAVLERI